MYDIELDHSLASLGSLGLRIYQYSNRVELFVFLLLNTVDHVIFMPRHAASETCVKVIVYNDVRQLASARKSTRDTQMNFQISSCGCELLANSTIFQNYS